ncbi:MAG: glycosyltransferase family 4 protein [Candidatus Omnitrophica bacterium]|nr:glycosyltransferase family 4 protein [Candidatus Omnitrophota bacterium]
MNILVLTTHLNRGGISRYVINLCKGLTKRGHKVFVASASGEWLKDLNADIYSHKHIPVKTKSIFSPKIMVCFFYLQSFIRQEKIDVIHANTRVTQCLAYLLYKKTKIPYISAFHGFYKPKFWRKMFKLSGLRSIAVSKAVKNHLVEDLEIEIDSIRVVYNGIDIYAMDSYKSSRQNWGFKESDFLAGILGRISAEKGHELAIEAVARLVPRHENFYFIISGEGKLKEKIISLISERNLEDRVRFVDSPANDFLKSLDLLLAPSEKEGFGFSIVEAFAVGLPVIGYNTGGIAELIKDRQNGILFNTYNSLVLADAIEELMIKPELRRGLSDKARETAAFFSLENMAAMTEKVYLEVLKA